MNLFKRVDKGVFKKFIIFLIIFSIGAAVGFAYFTKTQRLTQSTQEEKNTQYVGLSPKKAFLSEVYDKIKNNFWDNISDAQLIELFKLAAEKNGSRPLSAKIESREKLISEILSVQNDMSDEQKKKFIPATLGTVLASLNPAGRSGLYTQRLEEQLKNTVENVNPEKDLYKDLGVSKGASADKVEKAYQTLSEELKKESSPQAQAKLKAITYAKEVLTEEDKKARYDQKGVEPTIFSKIVIPSILYVQFKKFSPTSYDEFQKVFESYKDDLSLTGLIFDLRGNIGGSIDATPIFLGHFIGKNAYAFDFYRKGEYLPFKTPTDKLPSITRFKQIVILVDGNTQSSAELMTVSFKKYHVGVVLGTPTKGWGTVERVFPLENQIDPSEKYSIFLVHSITLRDDNQPIEGRGVDPDINTSNSNWESQLFSYFRNDHLTDAIKSVL